MVDHDVHDRATIQCRIPRPVKRLLLLGIALLAMTACAAGAKLATAMAPSVNRVQRVLGVRFPTGY
jgi:hypothetical protein